MGGTSAFLVLSSLLFRLWAYCACHHTSACFSLWHENAFWSGTSAGRLFLMCFPFVKGCSGRAMGTSQGYRLHLQCAKHWVKSVLSMCRKHFLTTEQTTHALGITKWTSRSEVITVLLVFLTSLNWAPLISLPNVGFHPQYSLLRKPWSFCPKVC